MNQDTLNKIETIAGYLKPLYDDLDVIKQRTAWHFMPGLIEEVEEWLAELAAPQQSTSPDKAAPTPNKAGRSKTE